MEQTADQFLILQLAGLPKPLLLIIVLATIGTAMYCLAILIDHSFQYLGNKVERIFPSAWQFEYLSQQAIQEEETPASTSGRTIETRHRISLTLITLGALVTIGAFLW